MEQLNQQQTLSQKIQGEGDYTKCSQLTDKNFAQTCEFNILINKAIQSKDKSVCSKATETATVTKCEQEFDLANAPPQN